MIGTAIYGSRGANGVVLVTPREEVNQAVVSHMTPYYSLGTLSKKSRCINSEEFFNDRGGCLPERRKI